MTVFAGDLRNAQWVRKLPQIATVLLAALVSAGSNGGRPISELAGTGLDAGAVALAFHKVSGEALNLEEAARRSQAADAAPAARRPAAIKAEVERLRSGLAATSAAREFTVKVRDRVSEYDRANERFDIGLFTPGRIVPLQAFGESYRLVFVNAGAAQGMAVPRAFARELDARLAAIGRRVIHEVRFRVVGSGDPSGTVAGPRVIRAEVVSVRLLDRKGHVLFRTE
jgi:hypothetical protein